MAFGAFAPFPFKLGGSSTEGLTAEQHARACSDLAAAQHVFPFAIMTVDCSGGAANITRWIARYGSDRLDRSAFTADLCPIPVYTGTGQFYLQFSGAGIAPYFTTDDGRSYVFRVRSATGTCDTVGRACPTFYVADHLYVAIRFGHSGVLTDAIVHIAIYGDWSELPEDRASIYAYGSGLNKKNDVTENPVPFAGAVYRDLQEQRGNLPSRKVTALVSAENLALARALSYSSFRLTQQLRNSSTVSKSSGNALDYWQELLDIPRKESEPEELTRRRLGVFVGLGYGATSDGFTGLCLRILGENFSSITWNDNGGSLNTWTPNSFWPMNPGSGFYDIGGGDWYSDRAQVTINVSQLGIADTDFNRLINVDLYDAVQRFVPAWWAPKWKSTSTNNVWNGGVKWDDPGLLWDGTFDWG